MSSRRKAVLKWGYDRVWHRWPFLVIPLVRKFKRAHNYFPNLLHPRSLNEKILFRMLFDRRDHLPQLSGKVEGRIFAEKRLGSAAAIIPLIGVIHTADDVAAIVFPKHFVMKTSHGCNMNYLHTVDTAPNLEHLKALCRGWLAYDFAKYSREWCYKDVKRAILVEELITDERGQLPIDYKIFCYAGVPRFIKTNADRFTEKYSSDIFDCDWTHIPGKTDTPNGDILSPQPRHLAEMLTMAATLSRGLDFVRVDLYDTGRKVLFGEMTNTPGGAANRFQPRALDDEFGRHWKISTTAKLDDA